MTARGSHILIDTLSHRYGFRSAPVLENVSLTIEPAERVALVGRSGCGKSTLLHLLAGLVKPTGGSIRIDGSLLTGPSPKWNMMFQRPCLYPWLSVKKNAALGMTIAGEHQQTDSRVAELLEIVGLTEHADKNVQQLSGGQQQRVALARSLATQPELLMLDEPFAALDEMTRSALQQDVTRITKRLQLTQIIVTHDIDEALAMAKRILVMSSCPGRIVGDLTNDLPAEEMKKQIRLLLEHGAFATSMPTIDFESKGTTTKSEPYASTGSD